MIGLVTSMVGGALVAVLGLILGVDGGLAVWISVAGTILVFATIAAVTLGSVPRHQATLPALFPAPERQPGAGAAASSAPS